MERDYNFKIFFADGREKYANFGLKHQRGTGQGYRGRYRLFMVTPSGGQYGGNSTNYEAHEADTIKSLVENLSEKSLDYLAVSAEVLLEVHFLIYSIKLNSQGNFWNLVLASPRLKNRIWENIQKPRLADGDPKRIYGLMTGGCFRGDFDQAVEWVRDETEKKRRKERILVH